MVSNNIRIFESFELVGYTVDSNALDRMHKIALNALAKNEDYSEIDISYGVKFFEKPERVEFADINSFHNYIESEKVTVKEISAQYIKLNQAGIYVLLDYDGDVEISAFGSEIDFQFYIDKLKREVKSFDEEHNWLIRNLIMRSKLRIFIIAIILMTSSLLLINIFLLLRAQNIGVDIDPTLLYQGNEYFLDVEEALNSDSLTNKLNVLLKGQLKSFVNAQEFINLRQRYIRGTLLTLVISSTVLAVLSQLKRIYPWSLFLMGVNRDKLSKLQKRRDIWNYGIIFAFVINIIAGIVVTFLR